MEEKSIAMEMLEEIRKTSRRWFAVAIILLIALIGSNVAWLVYESQFDYNVTEETVQEIENASIENSDVTQMN